MRYLTFFPLVCLSYFATGQNVPACCSASGMKTAAEAFAAFGSESEFLMAHDLPLPYDFQGEGQEITFSTPDGSSSKAWLFAAAEKSRNYVLVIHEWWGLNDHIKREAARLRDTLGNAHVIALDLYDGKVATDRENAAKYMQSATKERCEAIIRGAMAFAGKKARFGAIGWCFGGGWSNQASILAGKKSKACVMYYGMPESDPARLKMLKAPVLGIFAEKDGWITPEVAHTFEKTLTAQGNEVEIHIYNADHGFANPSSPRFDNASARSAWEKTLAFFRKNLP